MLEGCENCCKGTFEPSSVDLKVPVVINTDSRQSIYITDPNHQIPEFGQITAALEVKHPGDTNAKPGRLLARR